MTVPRHDVMVPSVGLKTSAGNTQADGGAQVGALQPNLHGPGVSRGTTIAASDFPTSSQQYLSVIPATDNTISSSHHVDVVTDGVKTYSRDEIIAFGGIPEPKTSHVRSSARIGAQATADHTQMERAMYAAQRRSDPSTTGLSKTTNASLLSFSPEQIISRATSLGVSLGNSKNEAIKSAKLILENEFSRSLTMLHTNTENISSVENLQPCLIVNKASNLCEDLFDEEDLCDEPIIDIPLPNNVYKKQRKKVL
jgi:hypothetical protein